MDTLKKGILLIVLSMFVVSFAIAKDLPLKGKKLVVIIKSADSSESGMGLALSLSALKKGASVTVVLGANAARYPLKKGGQKIFAAKNLLPRELIKSIVSSGGTVYLCSLCAKWQGIKHSDLVDGVKIVESIKIWNKLFESDVKSLTF